MEGRLIRQVVSAILLLALTSAVSRAGDCRKVTSVAQTGDLIFRFEDSWVSRAVLAYQGGDGYSHVGVVVKKAETATVFHAEYDPARGLDGVLGESVCDYLGRAKRGSLRRWKEMTVQNRREIELAIASVGPRKFNLSLAKNSQSGALYCTQYVLEIFTRVAGRDLFRFEANNVITVKQIADSNIFDQVALFQSFATKSGK